MTSLHVGKFFDYHQMMAGINSVTFVVACQNAQGMQHISINYCQKLTKAVPSPIEQVVLTMLRCGDKQGCKKYPS